VAEINEESADERNLFGLPGAEYMSDDIDEEYEKWADDSGYEPSMRAEYENWPDQLVIDEWTAEPLRHRLPSAERVVEWITEQTCDDIGMEEAYESMCDASTPDIYEAFQAALDLFGKSMVGWRMASKRIASHVITWDAEGEPMLNGERLYRHRRSPSATCTSPTPDDGVTP